METVTQLELNFGERYGGITYKEDDAAVKMILKGLARLRIDNDDVDQIMNKVSEYSDVIRRHQYEPEK